MIVKYCTHCVCTSGCISLCFSVHEPISRNRWQSFAKFSVHIACDNGLILLWWHSNKLHTSCFVDDIFAYNRPGKGNVNRVHTQRGWSCCLWMPCINMVISLDEERKFLGFYVYRCDLDTVSRFQGRERGEIFLLTEDWWWLFCGCCSRAASTFWDLRCHWACLARQVRLGCVTVDCCFAVYGRQLLILVCLDTHTQTQSFYCSSGICLDIGTKINWNIQRTLVLLK